MAGMNNQFKYRTRSTLGKGPHSGTKHPVLNGEIGRGNVKNVRRSLFNMLPSPRRTTPRKLGPYTTLYENKSVKPRSMLGRRKSLGISLSHDAVASQCEVVSRPQESTCLGITNDIKRSTRLKNPFCQGVSGLCVDKSLFVERTDLRKGLIQKRFLHDVHKVSNNSKIVPVEVNPYNPPSGLTNGYEMDITGVNNCSTNSEAEFKALEMSVMSEAQVESTRPSVVQVLSQIPEDKNDLDSLEENEQSSLPASSNSDVEMPVGQSELQKLLLEKMEEYNELKEAADNKWKEISEIRNVLKMDELRTVKVTATPGILRKSCSKSVRKNGCGSVKFNSKVSEHIASPTTPKSNSNKVSKIRKSIKYTPKSVKKIVNSQMAELFNL